MKTDAAVDRATKYAMQRAAKVGDIAKLTPALRAVVCITTGQAIIDNGGLQYFFESDFPNCPPYSIFVAAYRTIGAPEAADAIEKAVALFPFKDPHKHADLRNKFLDSFKDEDGEYLPGGSPFEKDTKVLCGNKNVWNCLKKYVAANEKEFAV